MDSGVEVTSANTLFFITCRSLQDLFVKEVKAVSDTTSSTIQQRKQHSKVQEKIQGLWNILQLCEKSLRLFSGKHTYVHTWIVCLFISTNTLWPLFQRLLPDSGQAMNGL